MGKIGGGLGALALGLLLLGCPGGSPQEVLETAQLEEVQNNLPHARKLYEEIVQHYPDSPQASTARARLQDLAGEGSGS